MKRAKCCSFDEVSTLGQFDIDGFSLPTYTHSQLDQIRAWAADIKDEL